MHISSKAGTEIFKNEYQIIDGINGIPTLETDYSQLKYNHPEPMVMLSNAYDDRFIMIIKEQESVAESSRLRLTGVHSFIYDFSLDRIYEEYTQYFSLENILSLLFDGTDYTFEVKSDIYYYALDFQNFGDNDKMSLINQICDRWELEYHVTGNKVVFGQKRGRETTKQFRYKMNIADSSVNLDISEGATYIRAYFGKKDEEDPESSTYTEREMTHPLAEDFGIRHAEPYSNENITQEETMQRYMKMKIEETWKLSVEIDVTELIGDGQAEVGDTVWAIDERMDLQYKTRIIELRRYYNKNDEVYKTKAILGNKTFIEAVSEQEVAQSEVQEVIKYTNRAIETLKGQFDNDFNAERDAIRQMVSDATNAAHDEIEAAEQRMTNLIEGTRTEFTDNLNAEITQTKEYAEQQAQEKAAAVRTDLETVTSGHQSMLDALESNVMNIDDFIGDKTVGLNELLYNERMHMEERINSINTWHYNSLKETQTLEAEFWEANNGEIVRSDSVSYFRKTGTTNISTLRSKQEMFFEAGETYTLTFEVQTFGHRRMDYIWILNRDTTVATGNYNIVAQADEQNAQVIYFGSEYRRYFITFTMQYDFYGVIQIGGNATNNEIGHSEYRIRKPYLTQSDNRNWLYHPDDDTQSIEEITRRITQLEDGREEFITRTQYDFETGEIQGTVRNILETVDESSSLIANHDDWILNEGSHVSQMADEVFSKVWLSDIHNPNMIPHSRFVNAKNIEEWGNWSAPLLTKYGDEWLRVRNMNSSNNIGPISPKIPDKITAGQTYTISWEAFFNLSEARISSAFDYMYVMYSEESNRGIGTPKIIGTKNEMVEGVSRTIYQYELTFTAHHTDDNAAILFGTTCQSGQDNWFFMRQPKLELGDRATPYYNAYSMFNQRADEMQLAVQDTISQSDISIRPEYVQIGSQSIDGSDLGALLRVSPDGVDMVAEAMRLSGDLYVDGDIEAITGDFIEGNFARLFANQLTTNVITSDHIQASTTLIDKMFATSARIDELITKTHFVNEMHALTLNVVDLNASQIRTKMLTSDVITSTHLNVNAALANKFNANTAFISRLEVQAANIRDLSAVHIQGGLLDSLNGRTRFNLNDGRLTMANTYFELGGGAEIRFTSPGNSVLYSLYDSSSGYARLAGMGVGRSVNNTLPFAYLGTYAGATMDTLGPHFSGLFVNTTTRIRENNSANSIMGQRFRINRDQSFSDFLEFDMFGTNTIKAYGTWDIGEPGLGFRRAYINNARSSNDFFNIVYAYSGSRLGYRFELTSGASSGNAAFLPEYGHELFYNLGTSTHVWRRGYINVLHYNTLEQNSLRELKDSIENLDVEDAKDYIRNTDIQTFYYKSKNDDNPRTEYDMKVGIVHDDINIEKDYLIKSSESTVDQSNITFMIQSVVKDNLYRLDTHETRLEKLEHENKMLKAEIKQLKGA